MGSLSRMSRSERFIREFQEAARAVLGLQEDLGEHVVHEGLYYHSGEEVVRFGLTLRGEHTAPQYAELCYQDIIYDPEDWYRDSVERVAGILGMEEETVVQKMKAADLIDAKLEWKRSSTEEGGN